MATDGTHGDTPSVAMGYGGLNKQVVLHQPHHLFTTSTAIAFS